MTYLIKITTLVLNSLSQCSDLCKGDIEAAIEKYSSMYKVILTTDEQRTCVEKIKKGLRALKIFDEKTLEKLE